MVIGSTLPVTGAVMLLLLKKSKHSDSVILIIKLVPKKRINYWFRLKGIVLLTNVSITFSAETKTYNGLSRQRYVYVVI